MNAWDRWNLSKMASSAEQGWFYERIDAKTSILVQADKDCTRSDCPRYGTVHRHVPTPEQRAEMQAYIVRYEQARVEFEEEKTTTHRLEQESIAECYRIIALDDPRDPRRDELKCISQCARLHSMFREEWHDPDAESTAECERIWSLEDPRPLPDIAFNFRPKSPTVALLEEMGLEVTVENWLEFNGLDPEAEIDGEIYELLPPELQRQYDRKHR
jgi:hypothetical protein